MSMIRAIVVDPAAEGRLGIGEVEAPRPKPWEALLRVSAVSLNLGEVRTASRAEAGWRPGWDLAGVVEQAAADGSGPPVGASVFGLVASGSWSELAPVPTALLAEIPETVTFAQAATLPVAGLTALYALEKGGFLLGRKVLVTGASGGVGHLACQLALASGAVVTALVRREERAARLREMGVNKVLVGEQAAAAGPNGPYDFIVDTLGGPALNTLTAFLEEDGRCMNVGAATEPEMTLQARLASVPKGVLVLEGIGSRTGVPRDLESLARLVAAKQLNPHIGVEAPWTNVARVAQSLMDRRITGKAVLIVS